MTEQGWQPPKTCDQCPHPISEHTIWEPDSDEAGWMHCRAQRRRELRLGCCVVNVSGSESRGQSHGDSAPHHAAGTFRWIHGLDVCDRDDH
jgi:hypothetical protein